MTAMNKLSTCEPCQSYGHAFAISNLLEKGWKDLIHEGASLKSCEELINKKGNFCLSSPYQPVKV